MLAIIAGSESRMYDILNLAKREDNQGGYSDVAYRDSVSGGRYVTAFDNHTASKRTGEPVVA